MTSKIVVNNIESDSGIGSVTFTSDIELGTKNLKGHNLESTGIITATSFVGSGANLTNIPAGNLTGTIADARISTLTASKLSGALPALDGSALTGINAGVGTEGSVNTSGIITATAFNYTGNQNLSNRNLIINGDFQVAQRATSSTSEGYGSVDRFRCAFTVPSENPTQSQVDVSSGTTPYTLGFRKAFKIQNGNQTSIATNTNINLMYRVESQDIANSGWNYTSTSSFITLSFWIKASVAQNYYGFLLNEDTNQNVFPFETGTLTADTWTKIIKTIPGNSNLTFNNDTGAGLRIAVYGYLGTGSTGSMSLDTWVAYNHPSTFTPNNTSTWFTTNDATLEFTGFQLELGPVATPFEHRTFGEQLSRCERYYQKYGDQRMMWMTNVNGTDHRKVISFPTSMRAAPTMNLYDQSVDGSSVSAQYVTTKGYICRLNGNGRHAAWKHEADAEI